MNDPFIEKLDSKDPEIAKLIRKNEITAFHAARGICKRIAKLEPEQYMEAFTNILGIMCSEHIRSLQSLEDGGVPVAKPIADILRIHIQHAEDFARRKQ